MSNVHFSVNFLMIKNVVDHRKRECKNTCEL